MNGPRPDNAPVSTAAAGGGRADDGPWTIQRILTWSTGWLAGRGHSETPRLDVELLLARTLGLRRIDLYVNFDRPLSPAEREGFKSGLRRRGEGEPVAYITGEREFFGLTYAVNPEVLIPRADTEVLVEAVLAHLKAPVASPPATAPVILDIGTGSGCIAVTLAARLPGALVEAWDVSAGALATARGNAARHGVEDRVRFSVCDALLADSWLGVAGRLDLLVANPPYIPRSAAATLPVSVAGFEPALALYGGTDGLDFYRVIAARAPEALKPGGFVALEVGDDGAVAVQELLRAGGLTDVRIIRDYARLRRVVTAVAPGGAPGAESPPV